MVHRKGLVSAAALAALACAGIVRADTSVVADEGLTLQPRYFDDATTQPTTAPAADQAAPAAPATPPTPLMGLLEKVGVGQPLEAAGIKLGGFVDGGYTASFQHPPGNAIAGRFQDNKSEHLVFDQVDFAIDRTIPDFTKFDIGGHFEFVYGRDTEFFHSTGIYDNPFVFGARSNPYYRSTTYPENQADIVQAYLDVSIPVGTGLRIRAGKIVTYLGYEVINPTGNPFYSHSFLFTYAIPLTNTGIFGEYKFNAEWQIDGGVSRGWSQSIKDNNGDPDAIVEVTYTPQGSDFLKKFTVIGNFSEGPEATHDNHDWWTVADVIVKYVDGPLTLAINADYGDAPHGVTTSSSAQWFGAAYYASYVINPMFTLNFRGEWYQDATGFTLAGFTTPSGATPGGTTNLYEATLGVAITPFPDNDWGKYFVIRPEIRGDYASKPFFNGDTKYFQSTFGIDAYYSF